MSTQTNEAKKPTPTRPGSKWATGRRRVIDSPREPRGFHQGARVSRPAAPKKTSNKNRRHRRRRRAH